jgi:predicted XRE-type DNA-binding protein
MKRNGPYPKSPVERFWTKVDKRSPTQCWPWLGAVVPDGYGFLLGTPVDGKVRWIRAHRLSWEIANGSIPAGGHVLHHCDNPACVNPAHLYVGSHQQNMRDRAERKRGKEQHGESNTNAKLSAAKVEAIRVLIAGGLSQTEVARMFGMSQPQVSRIVRRVAWKDG